MSKEAYCPTCKRTLYTADDDASTCPVCSSVVIGPIDSESKAEVSRAE